MTSSLVLPLLLALFWIFSGLSGYLLIGQTFSICKLNWSRSNRSIAALIAFGGPGALVAGAMAMLSIPNLTSTVQAYV